MTDAVKLLIDSSDVKRKLPVNIEDADRIDFQSDERYETYLTYLRSIGTASVSSDSVIYKNGIIFRESLYSVDKLGYYRTRYLVKKLLCGKRVKLDASKKHLIATDQESYGHFHWLTEVLPRLWLIRDRASEFILLLPDHPYVRTIGIESLEILGFRFDDIVFMKDDRFFKVKSLYHVSKVSRTGQMHDRVMKELREAFTREKKAGKRRIYISREKAARRKILNEKELLPLLDQYGFEVFSGEEMSLHEQIDLFSECETLIGIHGAGLTNCLFMKPGKVVELKKKEPNHGYWHLASSLDHKYYYYNGVPDSDASLIGQGCNLTIPVEDFEKEVLKGFSTHPNAFD